MKLTAEQRKLATTIGKMRRLYDAGFPACDIAKFLDVSRDEVDEYISIFKEMDLNK